MRKTAKPKQVDAPMALLEPVPAGQTGQPANEDVAAQTLSETVAPGKKSGRQSGETIRLVCATRYSKEDFFSKSPLGRCLPMYRSFPRKQRIELRLFPDNREGLPVVYNTAIEEAKDNPAVLVFIHDDVFLNDFYWAERLLEGLQRFDIVGIAGNRRRVPGQPSWMYLDDKFTRDKDENLSGVIGHGKSFPELKELSFYGMPGQEVKLLDGVLLAVRSSTLQRAQLRFDPRFSFDFYDLDICRQAELKSLRMGTWPLSIIHASWGNLGGDAWGASFQRYVNKYGEQLSHWSSSDTESRQR